MDLNAERKIFAERRTRRERAAYLATKFSINRYSSMLSKASLLIRLIVIRSRHSDRRGGRRALLLVF